MKPTVVYEHDNKVYTPRLELRNWGRQPLKFFVFDKVEARHVMEKFFSNEANKLAQLKEEIDTKLGDKENVNLFRRVTYCVYEYNGAKFDDLKDQVYDSFMEIHKNNPTLTSIVVLVPNEFTRQLNDAFLNDMGLEDPDADLNMQTLQHPFGVAHFLTKNQ